MQPSGRVCIIESCPLQPKVAAFQSTRQQMQGAQPVETVLAVAKGQDTKVRKALCGGDGGMASLPVQCYDVGKVPPDRVVVAVVQQIFIRNLRLLQDDLPDLLRCDAALTAQAATAAASTAVAAARGLSGVAHACWSFLPRTAHHHPTSTLLAWSLSSTTLMPAGVS